MRGANRFKLVSWMLLCAVEVKDLDLPSAPPRLHAMLGRAEGGQHGKGDFPTAAFTPTWDNSSRSVMQSRSANPI